MVEQSSSPWRADHFVEGRRKAAERQDSAVCCANLKSFSISWDANPLLQSLIEGNIGEKAGTDGCRVGRAKRAHRDACASDRGHGACAPLPTLHSLSCRLRPRPSSFPRMPTPMSRRAAPRARAARIAPWPQCRCERGACRALVSIKCIRRSAGWGSGSAASG